MKWSGRRNEVAEKWSGVRNEMAEKWSVGGMKWQRNGVWEE